MLGEKLQEVFGNKAIFIDIDNIPLGVDFRTHVDSAIGRSDILLALIGDSWLEAESKDGNRKIDKETDLVRIEIESALDRKIPVVPVLVDNAQMPNESELPESLSSLPYRNAAEIRPGRDLKNHINMLVKGLEMYLKPKSVPDEPSDPEKPETPPRQPKPDPDPKDIKVEPDKDPSSREGIRANPRFFNFKTFIIFAIISALSYIGDNISYGNSIQDLSALAFFISTGVAGLILLGIIGRVIMPKGRIK
jgi:hypothetical protein